MIKKLEMDRRSFVGGLGVVTAGIAATALTGCGNKQAASKTEGKSEVEYPEGYGKAFYDESTVELPEITKFDSEKTYDIVVVGAGTSGMPAVLTALEEGATVGVLQKLDVAMAYGNGSGGILLKESGEHAVLNWIQGYRVACNYRCNLDLTRTYAHTSGEAICWVVKQSAEAKYLPVSSKIMKRDFEDGTQVQYLQNTFGTKPENNSNLIQALAKLAEDKGAEFFYSTPAVQLVKKDGKITGVVGKTSNGKYVKLNANKAVILTSGDYQNNQSMVEHYCPDFAKFGRKQQGSTGDAILMSAAVGGRVVPTVHPRTAHDVDTGPMAGMARTEPFFAVNEQGERFMNEDLFMAFWGQALRYQNAEDPGKFCQIWDDNYEEQVTGWGGKPTAKADMDKWIPGKVENAKGVYPSLVDTHCCNTLDELADELGIPADKLKASVARYNELCEKEFDEDFGKPKKYMQPIKQPPFWGVHRWIRISAIHGGVAVNGNYQVIDENNEPIPGLYAAGFASGDLCGAADWIVYQGGMSCGFCMTSGRGAALHAVTGGFAPTHPVSLEDIASIREKL